jgi:hypothetical protein
MNVDKLIEELHAEIEKLKAAVACLEKLKLGGSPGVPATASRRGRKFMDAEERREVSERMKKYWAGHRRQQR